MSLSSSDSDFTESSHGEEVAELLKEWEHQEVDDDDVFVDSESEHLDDDETAARKMALLSKQQDATDAVAAVVPDTSEESAESESEEAEEESASEASEEDSEESEESSEYEEVEVQSQDEVVVLEEEESVESECEDSASEEETLKEEAAAPEKSVTADDDEEDEVIDDGNIEDTLKKKPKKKKEKIKVVPLTAPAADDDAEAAAMKALLSEWGGDEADEEDDDSDDDDEGESEASEREVVLEDNVIDHVVLAAPDLEEAMENFEKMTGIAAQVAGTINGLGIRCARISFNDSSYLEIIAPDPKSPGPIGQLLKTRGIKDLTPFHFAIRSSRAEELKSEVKNFGYVPDHITMFGGQKDGTPCKWEMLYLYGHKMGGICPFFINWANSDHPCAKLPVCGKLKKFTLRAPEDDPVHELLEHVGVKGLNVETGKPKLSFQFSSPEGTIKFATGKAVGFKFPGFDDDNEDLDVAGYSDDDDEIVFDAPETVALLEVGDGEYDILPPPAF